MKLLLPVIVALSNNQMETYNKERFNLERMGFRFGFHITQIVINEIPDNVSINCGNDFINYLNVIEKKGKQKQ